MKNLSVTLPQQFKAIALGIALGMLTACANFETSHTSKQKAAAASEFEQRQAKIAAREAELARREAEIAAQERLLEEQLAAADGGGEEPTNSRPPGLPGPPVAEAGECYAQVIVPAKFNAVTEKVLKREASSRFETIPATFETRMERVLVREAETRLEVIPAVLETITEQVELRPETRKIIEIPAEYETVTEEVMVEPARREWKYLSELEAGGGQAQASPAQMVERFGDYKVIDTRVEDVGVMCLVEIPATYRTIEKRVVKKPAETRDEIIPAEYGTVEKVVVKTPAQTREVVIPAEYKMVARTVMTAPATTREIIIPADYEERIVQEKVSDASIEWRPVLCRVNMTRENVSALQSALKAKGHGARCEIDGMIGPCTMRAAQQFAIANGLSWGKNYVTMDVIKELGLRF